jgi:hypothetical protein
MEENKALIGALIFIVLVVGANSIMFAIVRGAMRPGGKGFLDTISKSLNTDPTKKNGELEELRRAVQKLNDKNDSSGESPNDR